MHVTGRSRVSPRPKKNCRCLCPYPRRAFKPTGIPMTALTLIPLSREELEALRLCDLEGLTQEEAGLRMEVSRGTVQRLLMSARAKTARALTEGCALVMGEPDQNFPFTGQGDES